MKRIFKYPIQIISEQEIEMPQGAEVIHAGLDPQGLMCIWAIVDPRNEAEPVSILVYGTGESMPFDPAKHISSFQDGQFMWHVFLG